jgi:hypothetical protein
MNNLETSEPVVLGTALDAALSARIHEKPIRRLSIELNISKE